MSQSERIISVDRYNAEEANKLLDRGFSILLFKDGLGEISALAVARGERIAAALRRWVNYDPSPDMPTADVVFDGPNRMCGGGLTVAQSLHSVTEKVVFGRLPVETRKEASDDGE